MSLFKRVGGGQSATLGGTKRGQTGKVGNTSKATGRVGAGANAASNATSDVTQFTSFGLIASQAQTFVLTSDSDWVAAVWTLSVTFTGGFTGTSSDILGAIANVQVVAADGVIINLTPTPDFYMLQQRFGQYGVQPTPVYASASGSAYSATYYMGGFNLPQAKGPYSLIIQAAAAAAANASATGLTIAIGLSLKSGTAAQRLRTAFANLPFTPTSGATQDLAPLAPIQDVSLVELMFSGMSSSQNDIVIWQLMSQGSTVGPRVAGTTLVARQSNEVTGTVPVTELYPLLALQSNLTLGRNAHAYLTFGTYNPPTTIRICYVWFD